MRLLLLSCFCFCGGALAQPFLVGSDPVFATAASSTTIPDSYYPTNIPGFEAYAYTYYTLPGTYFNSGTATWINLVTGTGSSLNLTNKNSAGYQPTLILGAQNGYSALHFGGSSTSPSFLRQDAVSLTKPFSVFMVLRWVGPVTNNGIYYQGTNASTTASVQATASNKKDLFNAWNYMGFTITNKFYCRYDEYLSGTVTSSKTNNVSQGSGNFGDKTLHGLVLGNNQSYSSPGCMDVLDFVIYSTNLSVTASSNLYRWATNTYVISP